MEEERIRQKKEGELKNISKKMSNSLLSVMSKVRPKVRGG